MATGERQLKSDRLYLRVNPRERDVIVEAAEASHKDLSAFVLEAALERAERALADRRVFRLDDEAWERFNEALDRPPTPLSAKPRMEKLLRERSILEE